MSRGQNHGWILFAQNGAAAEMHIRVVPQGNDKGKLFRRGWRSTNNLLWALWYRWIELHVAVAVAVGGRRAIVVETDKSDGSDGVDDSMATAVHSQIVCRVHQRVGRLHHGALCCPIQFVRETRHFEHVVDRNSVLHHVVKRFVEHTRRVMHVHAAVVITEVVYGTAILRWVVHVSQCQSFSLEHVGAHSPIHRLPFDPGSTCYSGQVRIGFVDTARLSEILQVGV
mmetsp:Transcript_68385/g.108591  ORF Transcript_68385/g.108591 Transcript_68385/m.108591 type:complete len:226 (-) Transcript_68385:1125-1802(-)